MNCCTKLGYNKLPVNVAKSYLPLSHNTNWVGAPKGHRLPRSRERCKTLVGGGFLYSLLGELRTMSGLFSNIAFMTVDVDEGGEILGLL